MSNLRSKAVRVLAWTLAVLAGLVVVAMAAAFINYPAEYVYRVFAWRDSDAFDWQKFPERRLEASPDPSPFAESPDRRVPSLFAELAGVEDWEAFLEANQTQAFVVLQDGVIVYEDYFNATRRDSIVTSFSVAKSFTSALIGIAIEEGHIGSVHDPVTDYLPELAERDHRFEDITIRHLLLMASGLEYSAFRFPGLNSDDPLTTYFPDQRALALENTQIIDPPEAYFQYNKYHPQLLGMILERTTGVTVTDYLQEMIWDPIGMEYPGSWSLDSVSSGFEKMETGFNARAVDFAKFGELYRNGGAWEGMQVVPEAWVEESTEPYLPGDYEDYYSPGFQGMPGQGYYAYMWWGMALGPEGYDFAAEGDKGQFIYVAPRKGLVIVRNGIDYGIGSNAWLDLFYRFANEY